MRYIFSSSSEVFYLPDFIKQQKVRERLQGSRKTFCRQFPVIPLDNVINSMAGQLKKINPRLIWKHLPGMSWLCGRQSDKNSKYLRLQTPVIQGQGLNLNFYVLLKRMTCSCIYFVSLIRILLLFGRRVIGRSYSGTV